MEHCDYTLKKYIEKNNPSLTPNKRKKIILQFLFGLYYLHTKKILHRDISYNNVLIKEYEWGDPIIKLATPQI